MSALFELTVGISVLKSVAVAFHMRSHCTDLFDIRKRSLEVKATRTTLIIWPIDWHIKNVGDSTTPNTYSFADAVNKKSPSVNSLHTFLSV